MMIAVEEALARILSAFSPLPGETIPVSQGLGRVLAEDARARMTQPPKDVSAMDGYAVKAADVATVPTRLKMVAHVAAGDSHDQEIQSGETARIFTGAPLPPGTDSIVIQEDTEAQGPEILIKESPKPGNYVRPAGLDFAAGDVGIPAGARLTARQVGLAAAMDIPWLTVHRKPRVAILATGDEVVLPGEPRTENQIVSSNGFSLAALVEACGGVPINLGIARDNRESLLRLAEGARGADILVTTGGASVGEHDLIQEVLGEKGLELDFWRIAMRPGKPLMFGSLGQTPLLGLPGNPVSTLVCAILFLQPVLARMLGQTDAGHRLEKVLLGQDLPANDRRQDYLRARLELDSEGRRRAIAFGRQDSSMMATLARADCLVLRKPHAPAAQAGEEVDILPLGAAALGL
ncbi:molybdopterin molybdotransferase MoeA [Rhodovibrionaceae bacterium A322]